MRKVKRPVKLWREHAAIMLVLVITLCFTGPSVMSVTQSNSSRHDNGTPLEVFQVLGLPLNMHEAVLIKTDKNYLLRCSLANSSDSEMIGVRYSLVIVDSAGSSSIVANRTEALNLEAYSTKRLTFRSPLKLKMKDGYRIVLMVEQAISPESIWEVVKAKDALDAYVSGDYSVVPTVLRVANQVDAPQRPPRVIYHR